MIKHILIALVLVIGLSGLSTASVSYNYNDDGFGVFTDSLYTTYSTQYTNNFGATIYIKWDMLVETHEVGTSHYALGYANGANYYHGANLGERGYVGFHASNGHSINNGQGHTLSLSGGNGYSMCSIMVSEFPIYEYTVSGLVSCADGDTNLYIMNNASNYVLINTEPTDTYSFEIYNNTNYKLIFPDAHEYSFRCNNSSITYNHDVCSHTTYRFEESCGNLIPDSEGFYSEYIGAYGMPTFFHKPSGILDISNSTTTKILISTNSFIGLTGWLIDPVVSNNTYTLENPNIAWGLKVIVQNESNGELIDGAAVMVNQSCYCTSGYSTRNKRTVNGMVQYGDMSLQDAGLHVTKGGYKCLDENSTGYNVFLSGKSNFSSKTWVVKLANNTGNNSSEWYEVNNTVDIHFVDISGNRTSKILDTDASVDLYYENNNTEEEAMTLEFQSSSTHTYFFADAAMKWTIAYDDIGHKTIPNSYFTPWDYSYRAVIYNSSIYGWNITIPLTVRNATKEEGQHYENLTTNLWFMYASDGKVDYRDDLKVAIHAQSNNTTLMSTDIELWKDGVYIACKNLTATDFIGADFPYYYVWNPVFDYVTSSNYSVRMYGFDRTLLETDYVVCESDDTTRKNKLTIGVKDRAGGNLNNAYIYLEHWGSLPTGSVYYNSYEGIDNGDYRYKATKAGYSGGGWETVNLTDEDKIVWYVLSEDYTNTSTAAQKFTDDDIKGFFFPLMFFLLICIVLGGLKYVAS